jgi:putative membrane protein
MTQAHPCEPPWDPGVQNERTRLAWQRTTLSGLTCSLLVARLLAERSLPLAIAVGMAAVLSSATLGWFSTRRYVDNQLALHAQGPLASARSHLLLAGLAAVTSVGGIWYVSTQ